MTGIIYRSKQTDRWQNAQVIKLGYKQGCELHQIQISETTKL